MAPRGLAEEREPDRSGRDVLDLLAGGTPPAFATDQHHRITFWNSGAERLLGRRAGQVLGQRCHDVLKGRDPFGNRFCNEQCPLVATVRKGEPVSGCELAIETRPGEARRLAVTTLHVPGSRPEIFTLVHILRTLEESREATRTLQRLGFVGGPGDGAAALEAMRPPSASPPSLTVRETEILQWVAAGLQNKEIAQRLDISLATVRNHIHNILEKLAVHSKLEAISLAFRNGWVSGNGAALPAL